MRKQTCFRHPIAIRTDERITHLLADYGPAGYGVYWMIIEMLHCRESAQIEYDEKMIKRMAAQTGMQHLQFRQLLHDMIHLYDLLSVNDNYLASVLAYRKPRKRAQNITIVAEANDDATQTTPEQQPAEEHDQINKEPAFQPPQRQYSLKDLQFYDELKSYIENTAPQISQLKEPFTLDQMVAIRATYDEDLVLRVLEDMQQTKQLTIHYTSAYETFCLFANRYTTSASDQPMKNQTVTLNSV